MVNAIGYRILRLGVFLALLLALAAQGWAATIDVQVDQSSDDAEEAVSNTNVVTTSSDLELVYDTWGSPDRGDQIIGVRFNNIDMPRGAIINSASIEFQVDETDYDDIDITIEGESVDSAATFAAVNGNISSRPRTAASVTWSITTAWNVTGVSQQTADIATIVQEIVNRDGWLKNNSMAFIFSSSDGRSDSSNRRVVETIDGASAPRLRIDYSLPPGWVTQAIAVAQSSDDAEEQPERPGDNNRVITTSTDLEMVYEDGGWPDYGNQVVGIRFQNITAPKGATIETAYIIFHSKSYESNGCSLTFRGEASNNSLTFAAVNGNITGRATTAASVSWNGLDTWSSWGFYNSPDLSAIVQEIINDGGWTDGNAISFIITGNAGGQRRAYSVDDTSGSSPPQLYLEYSITAGPTADVITPVTASPTNSATIDFTVTFSQAVQNFDAVADLIVAVNDSLAYGGATITDSGDATTYNVAITGVTGDGAMRLTINNDSDVENLFGNALQSSVTSAAVAIDRTAPSADVITPVTGSPTNNDSLIFTVQFSEAVQNFNDGADGVINITGTVLYTGGSIVGGPQLYTVTLTGVSGDGTLSIAINTGSDVADAAGNTVDASVTSAALTIDNTKPASASWKSSPDPTTNNSICFSFSFSESVWNFAAENDLIITQTGTVDHTGVSYTVINDSRYLVCADNVTGDGTILLDVDPASDVRDAADNPVGVTANAGSITVDNTGPSADTITPTTASPTTDSSVFFTVTFNERVQDWAAPEWSNFTVTETGTVIHGGLTLTDTGDQTSYTVEVWGVSGDGTMTLAVKTTTGIKDFATNGIVSSVTSAIVVIDNIAPDCDQITPTTGTPTNNDSIYFAIRFTEAMTNFNDSVDVIVGTTGTVASTGVTIIDSGDLTNYTVIVTGVTGDGNLNLTVKTPAAGSDVRDLAANDLNSSVTSTDVLIDNIAPQVNGVSPWGGYPNPTNLTTYCFLVRFSEDVQGFNEAADLVYTEVGTLAHLNDSITNPWDPTWFDWYKVCPGGITGDGTMQLAVKTAAAGSDITDYAGNGVSASVTNIPAITFDLSSPTADTITPVTASPTTSASVVFTVNFSENVFNFNDQNDLVINETGSVAHTGYSIAGGPQNFTVTVTGVSGDGQMTLAVNDSSDIQDGVANALASSVTSAAVVIDNTVPDADQITAVTGTPTNNDSIVFAVRFTEPVRNFNAIGDLVITLDGLVGYTGAAIVDSGDHLNYIVTVTGVSGNGTIWLAVNTATADVEDLAGIALNSSVTSSGVVIDNVPPELWSVWKDTASPTNSDTVCFGVFFIEKVVNLDSGAELNYQETGTVAHTNDTITKNLGFWEDQWFSVCATGVTGDGTMELILTNDSDVQDLAGNALLNYEPIAFGNDTVIIDNTGPYAITVDATTPSPTVSTTISFDVEFDERTFWFTDPTDVLIASNDTVAWVGVNIVNSGDFINYTVNVTGASGKGYMRLTVADEAQGSGAADQANNIVRGSVTSDKVMLLGQPNAIIITPLTSSPTSNDTVTFEVFFDQTVVNFNDQNDLVVTTIGVGYTGAAITGANDSYTVRITGVSGDGTMTLAVNDASDVRNLSLPPQDLGSSVTSAAVTIDNTGPDADAIASITGTPTNNDSILFAVSFNESVQHFDAETDLVINETGSVAHTGVTFAGSGQDYTVTLTGVSGDGTVSLAVSAGGAGLTNWVESEDSGLADYNEALVTVGPGAIGQNWTLHSFSGNWVQITGSVSGAVGGFWDRTSDISPVNGAFGPFFTLPTAGWDDIWIWRWNGADTITFTTVVSSGDVTDLADNALTASVTSNVVTVDNTAPTADTITPTTATPTNSAIISFSVTFSEAVENFSTEGDLIISENDSLVHTGVTITDSGDATTYTVDITGVSGQGTMRLAANDSADIQDPATNGLASSVTSTAVVIDRVRPRADQITVVTDSPTNSGTVEFAVRFTEPVVAFNDSSDLTIVATGVAYTLATVADSGDAVNYTVTLTGVSGDGTLTVTVRTGTGIGDTLGNTLESSVTSAALTVDNIDPEVDSITPVTGSPTNDNAVVYTVVFSENVQFFNDSSDVLVFVNDSLAYTDVNIAGGPQTYTVTVTGVSGDGTMRLAARIGGGLSAWTENTITGGSFDTNYLEIIASVSTSSWELYFASSTDLRISAGPWGTGYSDRSAGDITWGGPTWFTLRQQGWNDNGAWDLWANGNTITFNTFAGIQDLASNGLASTVTSAAVVVDQTAPTADTVTALTGTPTANDSIVFTVAFSEDIENFNDVNDLVVSINDSLAFTGASVAGGPQNFTVTVTGVSGDGTMQLAVKTAAAGSDVADPAGNGLDSSDTSSRIIIDNSPPRADQIAAITGTPTNNDSIIFSVRFTEVVENFNDAADLTIGKTGTANNAGVIMNDSGDATNFIVTLTGVAGDGNLTLTVNTGSDVQDPATNGVNDSVTSSAVVIDNTQPTAAAITPVTGTPTNNDSIVFAVNFSEDVEGFNDIADLVITVNDSVTYGGAVITGGPQDYTVTITGVAGDGSMWLAVNDSTADVRDPATNALASSVTSAAVVIDNTAPTVTTVDLAVYWFPFRPGMPKRNPNNLDNYRFSVIFSEDMQNFNAEADLVIITTNDSTYTSVSYWVNNPKSYFVDLFGMSGDGTITLGVSLVSDVQDLAGNPLAATATSPVLVLDYTPPRADQITATTGTPTNNDSVFFTVRFTEETENFNNDSDVTIGKTGTANHTGVTITDSGDATNFTVELTGVSGDGNLTLTVDTGSDVTDPAANALNDSVTSAAVEVDNTAPTAATITPVTGTPTNNDSIVFTVQFSEDVENFNDIADLVITVNDSVTYGGATITGGPRDYTVTITGVAGDGVMWLAVNDSTTDVQDPATNALASSVTSTGVVVDNIAPTADVITPVTGSPTNSDAIVFTVQFSEDVENFNDIADLVITVNDSVTYTGAAFAGGPQIYTVTVTGVAGDGSMRLAVNDSTADVRDPAANGLASSVTSAAVRIDNTPPEADQITPVTGTPTNNDSIIFTVRFTEAIVNFNDAADLTIGTIGTAANTGVTIIDSGDATNFTVTLTGVSGDGNLTLTVDTSSDVEDPSANGLGASVTSAVVVVDNTAPTADTITPVTGSPTNNDSIVFAVHFSEAVENFDSLNDLSITMLDAISWGGTATITGGPQDYTVTITNVAGDGTIRLAVNDSADIRDTATNALASSVTSVGVVVDNTAPTADTITPVTASPTKLDDLEFTVTFSEAVQNLNALADLDMAVTGTVTYNDATFVGGPIVWTVTVTGVDGDGTLTLAVETSTDVMDIATNPLASTATSAAITVDNTAPIADSIKAMPIVGDVATFIVTFSEAVENFDAEADVLVSTSSLGYSGVTITGGPETFTVQVNSLDPGADNTGSLNLTVRTGTGVQDEAGNQLASSVTSRDVGYYKTSVSAGSDDAEEKVSNGDMLTSSVDLDMVYDTYGSPDRGNQIIGIRFIDLAMLPQGASVTSAYIRFRADGSDSGATTLTFYGQAIDDAPTFTTADDNISNRTKTTASVTWSVPSWSSGNYYNSPDLSSILQEIVSRPGWSSDDVVFIIEGSGQREAESEEGDSGKPELIFEYSQEPYPLIETDPTSLAIQVKEGNNAVSSTVTLFNSGNTDLVYSITDNDSWLSVAPTSGSLAGGGNDTLTVDYLTAAKAIGGYNASITIADPFAINNPYVMPVSLLVRGTPIILLDTLNLAPDVFEGNNATDDSFTITNVGNDSLLFTITTNDSWLSTTPVTGTTASGGGTTGVTVNYTTSGLAPATYVSYINVIDPYAANSPQSIKVTLLVRGLDESTPGGSSDDAEEDAGNGSMNTSSSDLELGEEGGNTQIVGIRFRSIDVPKNAVITNAYIRFRIDEDDSEYTDLYIWGQAHDDPGSFSSTSWDISSRTKLATSVHWPSIPAWSSGDIGQYRNTPDISPIAQELVNRAGWVPGNDMVYIITGVGHRTAESYDGYGDPLLHIEYMVGSYPMIELNKSAITADAFVGTDADNDSFIITNSGNADMSQYLVGISYIDGSGWLATDIVNDSLAEGASRSVGVTFSTTTLAVGTYRATITVTSPDALNSGTVNVTLTINGPKPEITAIPTYIGATAFEGNNAVADSFRLENTGIADLNYNIAITAATPGWLTVNPTSGTLVPGAFANIAVNFSNSSLVPATYEATMIITDAAASNSPVEISVSLLVQALPVGAACGDVPVYTENLVNPAILILLDISGSMGNMTGIADPISVAHSADIKTILQEIVNRPGWSFSNDIALIINGNGTDTDRRIATSWDAGPDAAPLLHIEFGGSSIVNIRVNQSSDDAEEINTGAVSFTSTDLDMAYDSTDSKHQTVGMRFRGLPLVQGETITAAWLEFMAETSTSNTVTLTIRGEDVDDAATFDITANNITSRPLTTATVSWTPANWTAGTTKTKLQAGKDVIGELVKDRSVAWGFGAWTFYYPGPGTNPIQDAQGIWYYAGYPTNLWTRIHIGCKFNDDTHQANLQSAIAGVSAGGATPLGPATMAAREYFLGNKLDEEYNEAFVNVECQPKFLIQITDGLGQSPWTDVPKMNQFTNRLYNDSISAVAVGFGIDDGIQIEEMAAVANARGSAVADDNLYALHEEVAGVGVPYIANSAFQLLNSLRDVTSNIKAQVFHGSAPAPTTSVEYGDIVITAKFDAASWSGNLIALQSVNDSFDTAMWEANDSINQTLRDGGFIDAWTVVGGGSTAVRYTDATLAGDNFMCKILGDIINSAPEIVESPPFSYAFNDYTAFKYGAAASRPRVVYIGANDGALHAINLDDGQERWRFYPETVHSTLNQALSDPTYDMCSVEYCHKYFVDGTPVAADVYTYRAAVSGYQWRTILLTGLREGGEAIFALDVTSGQTFDHADPTLFLWEYTDAQLGQAWSEPTVSRVTSTNDSAWGAFFGSGYSAANQANKEAYLYGVEAYDASPLWRTALGAATDRVKMYSTTKLNDVLSSPLLADRDFDNKAETLYTGNLFGTMFRVTDIGKDETPVISDPPLFAFTYVNRQNPIRAKADYAFGEGDNEIWVYFGTGKYDDQIDKTSMARNYFFGLKDNDSNLSYTLDDSGSPIFFTASNGSATAMLTALTITGNDSTRYKTIDGTNGGKRPWMLKLDNSTPGMIGSERVISEPLVVGGVVFFTSFVPDQNICAGNGEAWLYALDYATGLPPDEPVFDINNDQLFNEDDEVDGNKVGGIMVGLGQPSKPVLHRDLLLLTTTGGGDENEEVIVKKVNIGLNEATIKAWKDTKVD